ncbi:unnamed protein product [Moneuplotes crassus]|uniref:Uncharacterized protein n=1 Tax=Euplotes crassus TaxID=5936 RepID=A0AAD1XIE7_EUPCR|nr:unnamed protein product [Moneuplotes crassus]
MDNKLKNIFSQNSSLNDFSEKLNQKNSFLLQAYFASQSAGGPSQEFIPSQNYATQGEEEKPLPGELTFYDPQEPASHIDLNSCVEEKENLNSKLSTLVDNSGTKQSATEIGTPSKPDKLVDYQKSIQPKLLNIKEEEKTEANSAQKPCSDQGGISCPHCYNHLDPHYILSEMQKFLSKQNVCPPPMNLEQKSQSPPPEVNPGDNSLKEIPVVISKSKKIKKKINTCGHPNKKHYAKGMCSICYHRNGRTKLAWKCKHKDKPNYAKGCCQTCYLSLYYNEKKDRTTEI